MASALNRLDEQPLRLVENTDHGSPLQELLDSDHVRKALATLPEFTDQVKSLAKDTLSALTTAQSKPAKNAKPAVEAVAEN